MKLDRFRAPALAAGAVLLISDAGFAFAGSPSAAGSAPAAPIVAAEPVDPDIDTLQEGDQTTPDAASAAGAAGAAVQANGETASTTAAAETATSETAPEVPEGSEAGGAEADGPGGHEDPAGQNVDHQFEGEE